MSHSLVLFTIMLIKSLERVYNTSYLYTVEPLLSGPQIFKTSIMRIRFLLHPLLSPTCQYFLQLQYTYTCAHLPIYCEFVELFAKRIIAFYNGLLLSQTNIQCWNKFMKVLWMFWCASVNSID